MRSQRASSKVLVEALAKFYKLHSIDFLLSLSCFSFPDFCVFRANSFRHTKRFFRQNNFVSAISSIVHAFRSLRDFSLLSKDFSPHGVATDFSPHGVATSIATTFLFVECVVAKYLRKKRDTDLLFNLSGYYRS